MQTLKPNLDAIHCGSTDAHIQYAHYIHPLQLARGGNQTPPSYPNPVSDILYIDLDRQLLSVARAASAISSDPAFDVRLHDGQGNLLRNANTKGGTVRFNVSDLPVGIYFLHINDGISAMPEIQQVIVER